MASLTKPEQTGRKSAVFFFGRCQPPHSMHLRLIYEACQEAARVGGDAYIFLSQSHNIPKNPIPPDEKRELLNMIYKETYNTEICHNTRFDTGDPINTTGAQAKTINLPLNNPFHAFELLQEEYDDIIYICGQDRENCVNRFRKYLKNGKTLTAKVVKRDMSVSVSGTECRKLAKKIYSTLKQTSSGEEKVFGLTYAQKETIKGILPGWGDKTDILISIIDTIGKEEGDEKEGGELGENLIEFAKNIFGGDMEILVESLLITGGRKKRKTRRKMPEPKDKTLYQRAKKYIYKKYPKHSAYRSGLLVKKYKKDFKKKHGNKSPYSGKKTKKKGLKRWFAEKWVNQRGKVGYKYKNDIYRPSKRITRGTPLTHKELSKKEINRARTRKYKHGRVKFRTKKKS